LIATSLVAALGVAAPRFGTQRTGLVQTIPSSRGESQAAPVVIVVDAVRADGVYRPGLRGIISGRMNAKATDAADAEMAGLARVAAE